MRKFLALLLFISLSRDAFAGMSQTLPTISGGTDGTVIGNNQDSLKTVQAMTSGGVYGNLSVGTSAVEVRVGASRLTNRRVVTIFPVDENMWWGFSSAVTSSTGTEIYKNQLFVFMVDATARIYLISDAASKNARISESP